MEKQKNDNKEKMTVIYSRLTERERQLIEQNMTLAVIYNMYAYIRKMCVVIFNLPNQIFPPAKPAYAHKTANPDCA